MTVTLFLLDLLIDKIADIPYSFKIQAGGLHCYQLHPKKLYEIITITGSQLT